MALTANHHKLMKSIKLFFVKIRYALFTRFVDWEIYHRIFPHLLKTQKYEYPFDSESAFLKASLQNSLDVESCIKAAESRIGKLDKAYREAFQYIMYRDLKQRIEMFERLAEQRINSPLWNPCCFPKG